MYHKSAAQISRERIVLPDPDVKKASESARIIVSDYGSITDINNYVRAHVDLGKICESLKNEKCVSNALAIMGIIEELISASVVGPDRITIIKLK